MKTSRYDVLYSVPIPGLDIRVMAECRVEVSAGTDTEDLPRFVELLKSYPNGIVDVIDARLVR